MLQVISHSLDPITCHTATVFASSTTHQSSRQFAWVALYQQLKFNKMKTALLLRQYMYSIPASPMVLPATRKNPNLGFADCLQLMKIAFDFERGRLKLEGDWKFMVAANKENKAGPFDSLRERVFIDATIYPAVPINLSDCESDGLLFPLEGSANDGLELSSCSGLVCIESGCLTHGPQWNISFYIYDSQFENVEIKFTVPVYVNTQMTTNN
jgi:hypothetical protein